MRPREGMVKSAGRWCTVTDNTFAERAIVPLEGDELDGIVRLTAFGDGVGAIVASLAIEATMPPGEAVQGLILLDAVAMTLGIVTARLAEPGLRVLGHAGHPAVAAQATEAVGAHLLACIWRSSRTECFSLVAPAPRSCVPETATRPGLDDIGAARACWIQR